MRRKKRQGIGGLYLWAVPISYLDSSGLIPTRLNVSLWITTPTESIDRAVKKAANYIARHYDDARINGITSHGTIDA